MERHSSTSVEKATLKLLGVKGERRGKSYAHWIVASLTKDQLRLGAAYWWGRALFATQENPESLAEKGAKGKIGWEKLPEVDPKVIYKQNLEKAEEALKTLKTSSQLPRGPFLSAPLPIPKPKKLGGVVSPLREKGVIGLRLLLSNLKWTEEGEDPEATRQAAGEIKKLGQGLACFAQVGGVNVPELAVTLFQSGIANVAADGLMNTLLCGIDLRRSLVDQFFTALLARQAGAVLQSTSADWIYSRPETTPETALAILFLQEQLAKRAGLDLDQWAFTHALPEKVLASQGLVGGLSHAQLVREIFSQSHLWLGCGKKWREWGWWIAALSDAQGWETDVEKEKMVLGASLQDELEFNAHGKMARLAHAELEETYQLLRHIHKITLWKAMEEITTQQGGIDGIFQKSFKYQNPVMELLVKKACPESESY